MSASRRVSRRKSLCAEISRISFSQLEDSSFDAPPVHLQLFLAGAARADAAAQARKIGRLAPQTRQRVFELRQLHLQAAFPCLRALCKYIEYERRAVDHLDAQRILQIFDGERRKLVVRDHQIGVQGRNLQRKRMRHALADVIPGVRRGPVLDDLFEHHRARRIGQALQFLHALLRRVHADENGLFFKAFGFLERHQLFDAPVRLRDFVHQPALRQLADGKRAVFRRFGQVVADIGHAQGYWLASGYRQRCHRVEARGNERAQVHLRKLPAAVGMRMDAAHAGEHLQPALDAQIGQRDMAAAAPPKHPARRRSLKYIRISPGLKYPSAPAIFCNSSMEANSPRLVLISNTFSSSSSRVFLMPSVLPLIKLFPPKWLI